MANKLLILVVITGLVFSYGFYVQIGLADSTSILRPTADGGDDSVSWTNTAGTACNGADCSTQVNESSGASCTNSDGDTSYIEASVNGANQTFDLTLSSIPNDSMITQIDITVCQKRVGTAPGNKFQTRRCVDGACTNSGANLGASGAYAENSQSHTGLSITKTSSTDLEIGISITDTNNKTVRISQISAVVTYTLPSTPTPTPGGGDGAAVETVRGGGGNTPARIIFSGKAYPGATMGVHLVREEWGELQQVLIDGEFETKNDGSFYKEVVSPPEEKRVYALLIRDKDGRQGKSKVFSHDFKFNTVVRWENIIFPPTINLNKPALTRGELLLLSGYATPGSKVEALFDGEVLESIKAEEGGLYRILINTERLSLKSYKVQTRQVDSETDKTSEASEAKILRVSSFAFALIDFNGDNKVSVQDWSIFLSNWSSKDGSLRSKNDLNGDGKISVSDFSVFLMSFQLGAR